MIKSFLNGACRKYLLMVMLLVVGAHLSAQVNVSGIITSATDSEPLPGVTVYEKGTTNGVATDLDGKYELTVANEQAILVYSYIGFLNAELSATGRTKIDISLEEDIMNMEEVVVTAYSQKAKTEISSSVVSLQADEINKVTVNSVQDMLIGKVAGVQVQTSSGAPGSASDIRIRGVSSVFSPQQPLIVVDGIIGGSYNPNDIESVSVLKDAGATGLYGSAAAAGVILIKTKSGKLGKAEIRAKVTHGSKTPNWGNFELMNTAELYDYQKSYFSPALFDAARPESLLDTDFDWLNETYSKSNISTANISVSGATEKTNYYLSLDYINDEGTLRGTNYERISLRSNIKYQLNDRVNIATNMVFNHTENSSAHWNMSESAYRAQSWDQPYDENGDLIYDVQEAGWLSNLISNPYHSEQYNKIRGYGMDASGALILDIRITDWLKFNTQSTFGFGYGKSEEIYSPATFEGIPTGSMSHYVTLDQSVGNTSLFKFIKDFGAHGIDGLVGVEIGAYKSERDLGGTATGFFNGQEVMSSAGSQTGPSGYVIESRGASVLSQLNYNYSKKYFATLAYRIDGKSEFAPNNKTAAFLTYAASWLVSNEDFMEQLPSINYLKVRASYGAVGNSAFPDNNHYPYFPAFSPGTIPYNGQATYSPTQPANYNLTWETSHPLNVGLDFGFFNRVEVNLDYYNKTTEDLLFQNPMPSSQGYEFQWANVGKINNSGIEMAISATAVKTKDITWSLNFNISANQNEMKALSDKASVKEMVINRGDPTQILTVGGGAFDWYMPKWLGVNSDNGKPEWEVIEYDASGKETGRSATSDYAVAAKNYQIMGSPFPDFTGGFGTFLSYKSFSLSAAFAYSVGNDIYHSSRSEYDNDGENSTINAMKLQDGWSRWVNPGDNATHPEATYGGNNNSNKYSSRYLEDGSYLRLRNVTLAYDLPEKYATKVKLNDVRLSLSMDNIMTWTKFSGVDPDVPLYTSAYALPGTQSFKYPINKQILLGLEISF